MLGHRIRLLRCQKGLSQAELAHALHVSASTVGMYEQGHREPSLDMIVLIAREFEVTVDYLLTGRCICPQDIQCSAQVLRYLQKEIQSSICAILPERIAQKETVTVIAALLLDETAD